MLLSADARKKGIVERFISSLLSRKKLYIKILDTKSDRIRHIFITSVIHINGQVHLSVKFNLKSPFPIKNIKITALNFLKIDVQDKIWLTLSEYYLIHNFNRYLANAYFI